MSTLLKKITSAIYVNKSPNQIACYSGPASIYLQKLNSYNFLFPKTGVQAISNSDFRAISAPLFPKLGILDIYQINALQNPVLLS